MAEVDELVVKISANLSELKKGMKDGEKSTAKSTRVMADKFIKLRREINKTVLAMGPIAVAASAVAAGFVAMRTVMTSINSNTGLAGMADKLDITTTALSELTGVARVFNVDQERLGDTMKDLSDKISDAANNGAAYEESLGMLGLKSKDLLKLGMEEQFLSVVDALGKMKNSADQSFVSMDLMADAGFDIINMSKLGRKGIMEMRKEIKELGGSLSAIEASQFKEVSKDMAKLGVLADGIGKKMAIGVAPAMEFFIEQIIASSKNLDGMGGVFETLQKFAVKAVGFIHQSWNGLVVVWKTGELLLRNLAIGLTGFAKVGVTAVQWLTGIWGAEWDLMNKSFNLVIENVKAGFPGIRVVASTIFATIIQDAADMVIKIGQSMEGLPLGIGDAASAIVAQGMDLLAAGTQMAADADATLSAAQKPLDKATEEFKKAKDGVIDAFLGKGVETPVIDEMITKLQEARDESAKGLGDFIGQSGDPIAEWEAGFEEFRAVKAAREEEANAEDLAKKQEYNATKEEEESRYLSFINKLNKAALNSLSTEEAKQIKLAAARLKGSFGDRIKQASGFFGQMSVLMETGNRKQFEIGKAAAIAGAVVDTYRAATGAYAAMASIPVVGPVLGAAAAGAAIVAGMAQVNAIKSQSMGGGGGGGAAPAAAGGGGGGVSAGGGGGGAASEEAAPQAQQTTVNTTLIGDSFGPEQVRGLISSINEEIDDNTTLNVAVAS